MTVIIFIIVLSVLVLAHEFGHFITAKKSGVAVEEFGLGFPPKALEFGKKETKYTLNWIPLGGFVKLKGENGEAIEEQDSFAAKPYYKKAIILSAGVIMNVILAFVLLSFGYMIGMPAAISGDEQQKIIGSTDIRITDILPGSAAKEAGIKAGDSILSIAGQSFAEVDEVQKYVAAHNNDRINLKIKSTNGEIKDYSIQPQVVDNGGADKILGVGLIKTGLVRYGLWQSFYKGAFATGNIIARIVEAFYLLLKSLILGQGLNIDLYGPVGVAVLTGEAARMGFSYLIQFTAMLSLNLAVINIIPFPALDGGRLLYATIEKISKKTINKKFEEWSHGIGFALLMLLIIVITYKDIASRSLDIINKIKGIF